MRNEATKNLIHKIGLDNMLTDSQVRDIILSAFKMSGFIMRESGGVKNNYDYKSVRVPYLGAFVQNKKAITNVKAKKLKEEKNENNK